MIYTCSDVKALRYALPTSVEQKLRLLSYAMNITCCKPRKLTSLVFTDPSGTLVRCPLATNRACVVHRVKRQRQSVPKYSNKVAEP
jgi:hypothetical protein